MAVPRFRNALGEQRARAHFKSTLHVVHVVGTVPTVFCCAEAYVVSVAEVPQRIEDAARKALDDLVIDHDKLGSRPVRWLAQG